MPCVYFHDLPVYRLPEEAYHASRDKFVADFVADTSATAIPSPSREAAYRQYKAT